MWSVPSRFSEPSTASRMFARLLSSTPGPPIEMCFMGCTADDIVGDAPVSLDSPKTVCQICRCYCLKQRFGVASENDCYRLGDRLRAGRTDEAGATMHRETATESTEATAT